MASVPERPGRSRSTRIAPLQPGRYYHVFNRGNNRENLFREERNYRFFLERYVHHVAPVADTFAYCLLRNHFHLLVRIRPDSEWPDAVTPSQRFSNLFNGYTKAVNRAYGRTGSLFQKPFGRIEVTSERYFAQLICYIHQNPQRHGLVSDFRNYPHSSYHTLLDSRPTKLRRAEALAWFGGRDDFVAMHRRDLAGLLADEFARVDRQDLAGLSADELEGIDGGDLPGLHTIHPSR